MAGLRLLVTLFAAMAMQAMAFAPAKLGSLGTSLRTGRSICRVRMQTGSSVQQDSADAGEDDGPKLSRAQRRLQEKYSKKNTDGSAKATQQATGGVRVKKGVATGPPPDLIEVAFADEIPPEDGARKAVDLPSPVDGGGPVPLMLMRYKNKIMATAAQCTRCKFPLVGASYENDALKCKVCGTVYKLPKGEVVEGDGTLLSGLFSKTQATQLPVYATITKNGKVCMGVAPKPVDSK